MQIFELMRNCISFTSCYPVEYATEIKKNTQILNITLLKNTLSSCAINDKKQLHVPGRCTGLVRIEL